MRACGVASLLTFAALIASLFSGFGFVGKDQGYFVASEPGAICISWPVSGGWFRRLPVNGPSRWFFGSATHLPWPDRLYLLSEWGIVPRSGIAQGDRFVSCPLWIPAMAFGVAWVVARLLRQRPIPAGHCVMCRYNLTGNESGRCPECGAVIAAAGRSDAAKVG